MRLKILRSVLGVAPTLRRVAAGYAAKAACSALFVSGRELDDVRREDLQGVPGVELEVDREARRVQAHVQGTVRTAVYREGLGSTLLFQDEQLELPTIAAPSPRAERDALWPEGERLDEGGLPQPNRELLAGVLDAAFEEPDPSRPRRTRAVVVVHKGRLVAERYAPGFTPEMPLIGWSMTKSVTNALVGLAVGEGKVDLRQPLGAPEWAAGDRRATITWDMLLRMSSGLKFWEQYWNPLSHVAGMLFHREGTAAYAATFPLVAEPDARWSYSSGTSNLLARQLRTALGGDHEAYLSFPRRALFDRIGMSSALLEVDATGHYVGSSFSYATPRDWARFGLLYLQDGRWGEEQVLPEGWVATTRTPTPQAPLGQYGAQFWLNAGDPRRPGKRIYPNVPPDAFFARGFEEQSISVVPSREAVIVRLGQTADERAWSIDAFVSGVLSTLPT